MTFSIAKERLTALSKDGHPIGSIVFPRINAGLVNISQISVSPDCRGQGVEEAMMEALLSQLEKTGCKAALTAPSAQKFLREHPQWSHILPGKLHFTTY